LFCTFEHLRRFPEGAGNGFEIGVAELNF